MDEVVTAFILSLVLRAGAVVLVEDCGRKATPVEVERACSQPFGGGGHLRNGRWNR